MRQKGRVFQHNQPDPAIVFLCCVRSQREKCGMSEKLHAVAQPNNWPFVQVAGWIKRRTYRSRTKRAFAAVAQMAAMPQVFAVVSQITGDPYSAFLKKEEVSNMTFAMCSFYIPSLQLSPHEPIALNRAVFGSHV
jgi:hypothetical protein